MLLNYLEEENKLIEAGFDYVRYNNRNAVAIYRRHKIEKRVVQGSGSIVRLSMTASRAADPGSNPGRSTKPLSSWFSGKKLVFNNEVILVS